ncbi:MAG: type II secretion system F family protein [Pseudomonadota bacterium]
MPDWLPIAATGLAAGAAALILTSWLPWLGASTDERLRRHALDVLHQDRRAPAAADDVAVFADADSGRMARLRTRLDMAVVPYGGWQKIRLTILGGLLLAIVVAALLVRSAGLPTAHAILGGLVAGTVIAILWVGQLRRRWRIAFLENLADAIDLVIRAVKAGIPVVEAIRTAGREVNEPVRSEFARITEEVDIGGDLRDALRRSARRVRIADVDFFVLCLILQRETGGQLAETLQGLSTVLRRRTELRLKTRALTAEGRLSVMVVAAIPILAGFGMYFSNPAYMGLLLEPGLGRMMLYVAVACHLTGVAIAHRLTQVQP